jgi:DnaJ-class molecular chaperone
MTCEKCQGTGLVLPEENIKYKSQATAMCPDCDGSGSVKEKAKAAPKPAAKPKSKSAEKRESVMTGTADATPKAK